MQSNGTNDLFTPYYYDLLNMNNFDVQADEVTITVNGTSVAPEGVLSVMDQGIDTPQLADDSVSTQKIQNKAVTTEKIQDEAVTTEKLEDLAVTNDKIGYYAV